MTDRLINQKPHRSSTKPTEKRKRRWARVTSHCRSSRAQASESQGLLSVPEKERGKQISRPAPRRVTLPLSLPLLFLAPFFNRAAELVSQFPAIPPNPSALFLTAMADRLRMAVVLAVGGAVAGGPEALLLLVSVAGRYAAVDVLMCVFLICAFTALILGTLLLALYFRVARPAAPAPGTELFAAVTAAVALAAMFMITTSLVAIPTVPAGHGRGRGLDGPARSCSA